MKKIITLFICLTLAITASAEVITHGVAERGLFFYKCNPGYQKIGGKCVIVPAEEPEKNEVPETQAMPEEKEEKEVIITKEKNTDAESYEFPLTDEGKRIPAIRNFMLHPENPKNVENFLSWQATHYNYVANLGYQIQNVVNMKGDSVYPVKRSPQSPLGSVYNAQEDDKRIQEVLSKNQEKIGLLYFYKLGCPACNNMKPIMRMFREKYPYFNIKAVTNTDKFDSDYEKLGITSYNNSALITQLGVTHTPTMVAVIEKNGEPSYVGISSGFVPLDQMEAQLIRMMINEKMIPATIFNPNRSNF